MKVERTIQIQWRLLGGFALSLLAVVFPADASIPREAASFVVAPQFSRILSNGSQQTQTLAWDGAGRLTAVSQRDQTSNNGYDWTALYDGLGRRLRTVYVPVDGGVACPKLTVTQESWYDPEVEFLELGVSVNGQKHWKMYGPDLDGVYGGLQGIGGLEAVIKQSDGVVTPVVNDAFGNAVASVTNGTSVVWNPTRVGGYGPLPGSSAAWLSTNTTLAAATVWRGKRMDPTGYYWQGARYYDPVGGRFLSPDPLGHEASMDLYSYANGDPINECDPDGRFGKNAYDGWQKSMTDGFIESAKRDRQTEIDQPIQYREVEGPNYYVSTPERILSGALHALPGSSTILGAIESFTGQNALTAEPADRGGAALATVFSVLPMGGAGGGVGRSGMSALTRSVARTEMRMAAGMQTSAASTARRLLGPDGPGQFVLSLSGKPPVTMIDIPSGFAVNRVFNSQYKLFGSGPMGGSFSLGTRLPSSSMQAAVERGLNLFDVAGFANDAGLGIVYRTSRAIPATYYRRAFRGTKSEVVIGEEYRAYLEAVTPKIRISPFPPSLPAVGQ